MTARTTARLEHLLAACGGACVEGTRARRRRWQRQLVKMQGREFRADEIGVTFVLRSVEESSVAETAETRGIAEETVRMRHFRAKGMLREALAREIDLAGTDLFEFGGVHCDDIVASVRAKLSL